MYDIVPVNSHDGESAAVVQPNQALLELPNSTPHGMAAGEPDHSIPFSDRFETIRTTPQNIADAVVEG